MTDQWGYPPSNAPITPTPRTAWVTRPELRAAGVVAVVLVVVGALLGLLWEAISPRTKGIVFIPHGIVAEESESLIAADGRFLVLTCAAGLLAALAAWSWRSVRGPVIAVALALGGFLGALCTDLVGRAVGGGHDDGPVNRVLTLPLSVHARGLLLVEALVALLVYGAFAVFARHDDLNVGDAPKDMTVASPPPWPPEPARSPQ